MAGLLPIRADDAAEAVEALIPIIADLTAAAADLSASPKIGRQADKLAEVLQDAAAVAEVLEMLRRRGGL